MFFQEINAHRSERSTYSFGYYRHHRYVALGDALRDVIESSMVRRHAAILNELLSKLLTQTERNGAPGDPPRGTRELRVCRCRALLQLVRRASHLRKHRIDQMFSNHHSVALFSWGYILHTTAKASPSRVDVAQLYQECFAIYGSLSSKLFFYLFMSCRKRRPRRGDSHQRGYAKSLGRRTA